MCVCGRAVRYRLSGTIVCFDSCLRLIMRYDNSVCLRDPPISPVLDTSVSAAWVVLHQNITRVELLTNSKRRFPKHLRLDCTVPLYCRHTTYTNFTRVQGQGSKYQIWNTFGWVYDTSVAMVHIALGGVFRRYPGAGSSRNGWLTSAPHPFARALAFVTQLDDHRPCVRVMMLLCTAVFIPFPTAVTFRYQDSNAPPRRHAAFFRVEIQNSATKLPRR